uniref:Uncharacterized protein n=1 Tax=Oryza brachyantha TaxID=4533 RepID=J3L0T5_ORYBR
MNDEQWCKLVEKWSSAKSKTISDQNKINRGIVKYPQTTGSRCYVAKLHIHKDKNKDAPLGEVCDDEVDAVELFKECHTSSRKGLSDVAKNAIAVVESLRAEPVADGQELRPTAEIVSKLLSQSSTNSTFLKNYGIPLSLTKSTETTSEKALREELVAAKQGSALLLQEVDELKKKSEAAEQALQST